MTNSFKGFGQEPIPTKVTTRSGLTKHLVRSQVRKTDDLSKWADSDERGMPVWWMPDQRELQCWWYSLGNPQQVGDEIHFSSIPMGFSVHFDARGVIDGFIGLNDAHEMLRVGPWPGDFPSARKTVSEVRFSTTPAVAPLPEDQTNILLKSKMSDLLLLVKFGAEIQAVYDDLG